MKISMKPTGDGIRDQARRLFDSAGFKTSRVQSGIFQILLNEYLRDESRQLRLPDIAIMWGEEPSNEEDKGVLGYPKTRSNLQHLRRRLNHYYEVNGYKDPVVIRLNKGSYKLAVSSNPNSPQIPDLDSASKQLILRAKTAIDVRTFAGAYRALKYWDQLVDLLDTRAANPRLAANIAFIPFALASIFPNSIQTLRPAFAATLQSLRDSGFDPWERTFAEGCIEACKHNWSAALRLFEVSVANSQGEAKYFWWYTALLMSQGRPSEAIEINDAAVRHFSRTNIATRTDLAMLLIMSDQYAQAEEMIEGCMDFTVVDNPLICFSYAVLFEAQNRFEEAALAIVKWLERAGSFDNTRNVLDQGLRVDWNQMLLGMFILVLGRAGSRSGVASHFLEQIVRRKEETDRTSSVEIAVALIGYDRFDEAVEWLERAAFKEEDPFAMWFHVFPPLRHLRGHPGYQALLERLKLQSV